MATWRYIVKKADDSTLENRLNEWTKNDLELVTLYPRGSGVVFVVFRKKTKE